MLKRIVYILIMTLCLMWTASAFATEVRIALVQGQSTIALQADHDFEVRDLLTGDVQSLPKGKYFAHVENGGVKLENSGFSRAVELAPLDNKDLPTVNGRKYDGTLQLRVEKNALLATNSVELEKFLYRVLPSKTMPIWPEEAIKAQAVAARSYVLHKLQQQRGASYDLSALDKEVGYSGLGQRLEKPAITKIIKTTEGQYMADAYGNPIFAVSTSSSGGKTEAGADAVDKNYSYLQSVEDFDSDSPEYTWELRISPEYVKGILEQNGYLLGKLANVRLSTMDNIGSDRSDTGRVRYIIFGGTLGTAKISGEKLAELLGLNSCYFDVETGTPAPEVLKVPIENSYGMEIGKKDIPIKVKEGDKQVWSNFVKSHHVVSGAKDEKIIFKGKGKGHGAGLSAWGAKGMASGDEPKNYQEILEHYYPGTHLVRGI